MDAKGPKSVKLENGLCHEIKQFIGNQEIRRFSMLVNKCGIYDEDKRARSNHYKILSKKKVSNKNHGKPYVAQSSRRSQKPATVNGTSGGSVPFSPRCFRCGKPSHRVSECKDATPTCFNYGGTWSHQ